MACLHAKILKKSMSQSIHFRIFALLEADMAFPQGFDPTRHESLQAKNLYKSMTEYMYAVNSLRTDKNCVQINVLVYLCCKFTT